MAAVYLINVFIFMSWWEVSGTRYIEAVVVTLAALGEQGEGCLSGDWSDVRRRRGKRSATNFPTTLTLQAAPNQNFC